MTYLASFRVGDDVYRTGANKGYWFCTIPKFSITNVEESIDGTIYTIKGTSALDETASFNYQVSEDELLDPRSFRVTSYTVKQPYDNYWD